MNYLERLRKLLSDSRAQVLIALVMVSAALGITAAVSPRGAKTYYFYRADSARGGASLYVSGTSESSPPVSGTDAGTVNINTASVWELAGVLPGIGEQKARAIVEYREITGGFGSVDELIEVDGIGEKLLERIRPYCRVSDDSGTDTAERP